ncbi:MAG: T9SS type A sorting domain-containing protein, partial [Bacteroidales bacterium]|nr:T9SS type A sorting domain-containing protein [Bacteroidales bacterium]
ETLAGKIRIYPVPARADIYAENISDVTLIEIFDITGNKQITEPVNGQDQVRIPVSHLTRGVYFIRLKTDHGTIMKRFIKE